MEYEVCRGEVLRKFRGPAKIEMPREQTCRLTMCKVNICKVCEYGSCEVTEIPLR
jgi:hypothetical protein